MAIRKMTFALPEDLAARFTKRVATADRSRYVADAIAARLARGERHLVRACDIVNADPSVREIETEFGALDDEIDEPWHNAGLG
jgi:hypothetical protein